MRDVLIILVMGGTIAYLLYGSGPQVVVQVNEPLVCEVIKHPTTDYTHLCKIVPSSTTGEVHIGR